METIPDPVLERVSNTRKERSREGMDKFWPLLGIWKELFHSFFPIYLFSIWHSVWLTLCLCHKYVAESSFSEGPTKPSVLHLWFCICKYYY